MSMQLEQYTNNRSLRTLSCEEYMLANPTLLPKPTDLPGNYIAYNPSGIWTVENRSGKLHDIVYLRVEPETEHLGKSRVRPYIVDIMNPEQPLQAYDDAEEKMGEDAALTRIRQKRLANGAIQDTWLWLLSCVDAQPVPGKPDCVQTLRTKFFAGEHLDKLEHIADGPEWMKDIRIAQDSSSDKLHVYGRPQPEEWSGNITHTTIDNINQLNAQVISEAQFIDEDLLPIGSGVWGGVNDIMTLDEYTHLLLAHRARRTGENGMGRQYEAVLYKHNLREKSIMDLGTLATANLFPGRTVKPDKIDLDDVAFPGGFRNGKPGITTFGLGDGSWGRGNMRRCA
jgi:hypothetical protein